ncbi:Septum-associated FtsK-like translocase of DNA [Turicibacter sanguinis]|nr:Septum-associated FtsK-like translocase of DNA [Turicibacter sanguinis]
MVQLVEFLVAGAVLGYAALMVKQDPLDTKEVKVLNEIFEECKLKNSKGVLANVYKFIKHDTYTEFYIDIPIGKSVSDLEKCIEAIETYFKNNASVEYKKNEVYLKIYTTHLKEFYTYQTYKIDKSKGLSVVLGMSRDGVIERNLATEPHLSVVGATGGGKSVYVNSMLCQLIENYSSDELELILLDLKGNELNEYKDLYHTRYHTNSVEAAIEFFPVLREEMISRYQQLGNHRTIQSYNKVNPNNRMKYQFIVVEECYSLIGNKEAWHVLGDILSKARACGMHLLLTTQRPTSDVIPGFVTTHLGIRVGLKTNKAQESKNAIELTGLERLTTPGSGIINFSGKYEYFQGFYISDEKIEQITAKYRRPVEVISTIIEDKNPVKKPSLLFEWEE